MPPLFIVTGGGGGVGRHTVLSLVNEGNDVVVAGPSPQHLERAVREAIRASTPGCGTAVALQLDLSSLVEVQRFVKTLLDRFPGRFIQGLVLHAATLQRSFRWSADGVESTFAVNFLGHYYLVQLLLPHLAQDARIVITSSGAHDPANRTPLPPPNFNHPSELAFVRGDLGGVAPVARFNCVHAYACSKLCAVRYTYALARTLRTSGSKLAVNAYDPGFIPSTGLYRNMPLLLRLGFPTLAHLHSLLSGAPLRCSTPAASGAFAARLVADPAFAGVSGKYFSIDHEEASSAASHDVAAQVELVAYAEELLAVLLSAVDAGSGSGGAGCGSGGAGMSGAGSGASHGCR